MYFNCIVNAKFVSPKTKIYVLLYRWTKPPKFKPFFPSSQESATKTLFLSPFRSHISPPLFFPISFRFSSVRYLPDRRRAVELSTFVFRNIFGTIKRATTGRRDDDKLWPPREAIGFQFSNCVSFLFPLQVAFFFSFLRFSSSWENRIQVKKMRGWFRERCSLRLGFFRPCNVLIYMDLG